MFTFEAPSAGGVRNELFGRAWYEEYPTTPGSFVLNGFMYALIGLYDLSSATVYAEGWFFSFYLSFFL